MKKYISIIAVFFTIGIAGCKKDFLSLEVNPNNPSVTTPQLTLAGALATAAGIVVKSAGAAYNVRNNSVSIIHNGAAATGITVNGILISTTGAAATISGNNVTDVFARPWPQAIPLNSYAVRSSPRITKTHRIFPVHLRNFWPPRGLVTDKR